MKKRAPEKIDEIFRKKLSDLECDPFPDTKERVFTEYFTGAARRKRSAVQREKAGTAFLRYAAAACVLGLLFVSGYLLLKENSSASGIAGHTLPPRTEALPPAPKAGKNTMPEKEVAPVSKPAPQPVTARAADDVKTFEFIRHQTRDERIMVMLPDSSKVYLNKDTRLSYSDNFQYGDRSVYLTGEAFFDVRKWKKYPFVIYTNKARIEVLGTSFNVKSDKVGTEEVTVATGRVLFAEKADPDKNQVVLTPGMKGYFEGGHVHSRNLSGDQNDLAWKTGKLAFNNAPMKEVLVKLEEQLGVKVTAADPRVFNCRFTGKFDQASEEEIVEILSLSVGGSFETKNGAFILKGKGCN